MGMAGLIFEPHPPNFENQYNFWRCSNDAIMIFDFSTGFRFSKISVECSFHLCSCPWYSRLVHNKITSKTQVQMTSLANCLVLNCSRHFAVHEISLSMMTKFVTLQCGVFWKKLGYWLQKYLATLWDWQLTTRNQNKQASKVKRKWQKRKNRSTASFFKFWPKEVKFLWFIRL